MKPSEEQWNRWLDGELSPEEEADALASWEAEDTEAPARDRTFFRRLSSDLREAYPAERTPPFPDFFNSHIQKQIRDLREEEANRAQRRRRSWLPDWFRLSWAVPLAAAAVVVLALAQIGLIGGRGGSQITYAYTPDEPVTAVTDFNEEANAMVVRLEGMPPLPEEFDLLLADGPVNIGADEAMLAARSAEVSSGTREVALEGESPVGAADFEDDFEFVGPRIEFTSHQAHASTF